MQKLYKSLAAFAAASMVAAPVAVSAAPAFSVTDNQGELEGNSSWIIGLLGLLAGVAAIIIVVDGDDDAPVSP